MCKKENNQYILTVLSGNTGWNYGVISDPTNGRQNLISVTRLGDNTAIELRNFWQTDRTLRDGRIRYMKTDSFCGSVGRS